VVIAVSPMYSMGGVYKVKLYSWLHPTSFDNRMTVSVILILYPLPVLVSHMLSLRYNQHINMI